MDAHGGGGGCVRWGAARRGRAGAEYSQRIIARYLPFVNRYRRGTSPEMGTSRMGIEETGADPPFQNPKGQATRSHLGAFTLRRARALRLKCASLNRHVQIELLFVGRRLLPGADVVQQQHPLSRTPGLELEALDAGPAHAGLLGLSLGLAHQLQQRCGVPMEVPHEPGRGIRFQAHLESLPNFQANLPALVRIGKHLVLRGSSKQLPRGAQQQQQKKPSRGLPHPVPPPLSSRAARGICLSLPSRQPLITSHSFIQLAPSREGSGFCEGPLPFPRAPVNIHPSAARGNWGRHKKRKVKIRTPKQHKGRDPKSCSEVKGVRPADHYLGDVERAPEILARSEAQLDRIQLGPWILSLLFPPLTY